MFVIVRYDLQYFSQYFDWSEPISKAPSHRLLAMLRAEAEGFVKLNVEADHFLAKVEGTLGGEGEI